MTSQDQCPGEGKFQELPLDEDIGLRPDVVDQQTHETSLQLQASIGEAVQVNGGLPSCQSREAVVDVADGGAQDLVDVGEETEGEPFECEARERKRDR